MPSKLETPRKQPRFALTRYIIQTAIDVHLVSHDDNVLGTGTNKTLGLLSSFRGPPLGYRTEYNTFLAEIRRDGRNGALQGLSRSALLALVLIGPLVVPIVHAQGWGSRSISEKDAAPLCPEPLRDTRYAF